LSKATIEKRNKEETMEGKTKWDEADEQNDERWLEEKEKENG